MEAKMLCNKLETESTQNVEKIDFKRRSSTVTPAILDQEGLTKTIIPDP